MSRTHIGGVSVSFVEDTLPPKVSISRMQDGNIAIHISDAWGLGAVTLAMTPAQLEAYDVGYSVALMQDHIEHQEQTGRMESVK